MCKVSIIIPNYNHAPYLKQRIDSVLNQTYQDFELIILDDKSPDNSKEIIESYQDNKKVSHIIYNKQNSGSTFKQWKKGIELAKGELIWIAESDDFASPEFLERATRVFDLDNCVNLSFTQSYRVNNNSEITDNCISWYNKKFDSPFVMDGREYIKDYLWDANTIYNASAVVFRKAAYPINDDSITELKFVGDWFVYIKLIENGKLAYLPEALNYFRFHESSVTSKFNNSKLHLFENYFILKHIAQHKLYNQGDKYKNRLNYLAGLIIEKSLSYNEVIKITSSAIKFDPYIILRLLFFKVKSILKSA